MQELEQVKKEMQRKQNHLKALNRQYYNLGINGTDNSDFRNHITDKIEEYFSFIDAHKEMILQSATLSEIYKSFNNTYFLNF